MKYESFGRVAGNLKQFCIWMRQHVSVSSFYGIEFRCLSKKENQKITQLWLCKQIESWQEVPDAKYPKNTEFITVIVALLQE